MQRELAKKLLSDYFPDSSLLADALDEKNINLAQHDIESFRSGAATPNFPTFAALCDLVPSESKEPLLISFPKAAEEWPVDYYDDFFNADWFGKLYLLHKRGLPSFSDYLPQLDQSVHADADAANQAKAASLLSRMNEAQMQAWFEFADSLLSQP